MFGLRLRRTKDAGSKAKQKPRFELEHHQRIRLYLIVTVALVILAAISIGLESLPSGRNSCSGIVLSVPRDSCYLSLANYTMNATLCSKISNQGTMAGCVTSIAVQRANATLCSGLSGSGSLYAQCVYKASLAQGSASSCASLPSPYSSQCAYDFAQSQGFSSNATCNYISNASQRSLCIRLYYYSTALARKNPAYCALLPNVTNQTIIGGIVQQNAGNYSALQQQAQLAELNLTPLGYCYYRVAQLTSDYALCSTQPGLLGQLCSYAQSSYSNVTVTLNQSICGSVPQQVRSVCDYAVAIDVALTEKNATACSQISSLQYRYSCMASYAIRYNASYCSQIPNATYRQSCYGSVANRTNSSGGG